MMKLRPRPPAPGGLIPTTEKDALKKQRHTASIATAKANENRWFYVAISAIAMTCITSMGWHAADKRFAENVRVAYVKLSPNGTYVVDYADEEKPVDWFTATVESKLSEFAEKRYSKRRDTITTDFGFANLMMSPEMRADFLENQQAAKVAAELVDCRQCAQVTNKIREVQSIDKDLVPGSKQRKQYNTLVFSTMQSKDASGRVSCANKIITLLWTFRTKDEIVSKREELRYNPLGQEIIRSTIKDDPTTVTDAECRKL